MSLETILSRVAADYGTDQFVPDADGVYRVRCDNMDLSIKPDEEGKSVLFFAPILEVPRFCRGELALVVLQVNHLFQGGEGASFSIDPESKRFCLQQEVVVVEDDAVDFASKIAAFLSLVERWYIIFGRFVELQKKDDAPQENPEGASEALVAHSAPSAPSEDLPSIPAAWLSV